MELSSLSEIDNIIQEEEEFSRKTPHLSITNQLSMIDSAIRKRQGDRRKHKFLNRKKTLHKGKMVSL